MIRAAGRRMRTVAWIVVALVVSASGSCAADHVACPDGWTPDEGDPAACREPAGLAEALTAEHQSGVYGFSHHVVPCAACGGGSCPVEVIGEIDLAVYAAADVRTLDDGPGGCDRPFLALDGAAPVATGTTAADGFYLFALPQGVYALTATSPNDGCAFLAGIVRIPPAGFVRVVFFFERF